MSVSTGVSKTRLVTSKIYVKVKAKARSPPLFPLVLMPHATKHETEGKKSVRHSSLSHRGHVVCGGGGLWKRCHSLSGSDTARKPKESVSDGTRPGMLSQRPFPFPFPRSGGSPSVLAVKSPQLWFHLPTRKTRTQSRQNQEKPAQTSNSLFYFCALCM